MCLTGGERETERKGVLSYIAWGGGPRAQLGAKEVKQAGPEKKNMESSELGHQSAGVELFADFIMVYSMVNQAVYKAVIYGRGFLGLAKLTTAAPAAAACVYQLRALHMLYYCCIIYLAEKRIYVCASYR